VITERWQYIIELSLCVKGYQSLTPLPVTLLRYETEKNPPARASYALLDGLQLQVCGFVTSPQGEVLLGRFRLRSLFAVKKKNLLSAYCIRNWINSTAGSKKVEVVLKLSCPAYRAKINKIIHTRFLKKLKEKYNKILAGRQISNKSSCRC
jgi:hypothetical protein